MSNTQFPTLADARPFLKALNEEQLAIVARWPAAVYRMWVRAYIHTTDRAGLITQIKLNAPMGGVL